VLDILLVKNVDWEVVPWLWVLELGFAVKVALHELGGGVVEATDRHAVVAAVVHRDANLGSQHLAELNTPLVERIDIPNETLHGKTRVHPTKQWFVRLFSGDESQQAVDTQIVQLWTRYSTRKGLASNCHFQCENHEEGQARIIKFWRMRNRGVRLRGGLQWLSKTTVLADLALAGRSSSNYTATLARTPYTAASLLS
jgi:hypothetical protein